MRSARSARWAAALAVVIGLAACGPGATPEPPVVVLTASPPATAAATSAFSLTPSSDPASPTPVFAAVTDLPPCSETSVGPCKLAGGASTSPPATATPEPSATTTLAASPTPAATDTPAPTATPARAADAPVVSETTLTIATYGWRDHLLDTPPGDPIYPYPRLDYDPFVFDPGTPAPQDYKAIVLENKYVSLTFLPELGGRLYRWYDKTTNRQLLYNNPVVKATAFGVRGWWLSLGGLEWSLPLEDHGLVEWTPWNYATVTTPTTAAVVFSIADERTGLECAIRIGLDNAHSYFSLTPVLHNPNASPLAYQFWLSAIAAPGGDNRAGPDLHFNVPVSSMLVHSTDDKTLPPAGQTISWPIYNGRDLSLYGNWTKFLSLFAVPGAAQSYVGLYTPRAGGGFVRIFPPEIARGLKLYAPGDLPPFVWTINDGDSSYVELWGGLTTSFAENTVLAPDDEATWTEYWYPFHGIGNYVWAGKEAALAVDDVATDITVHLYLTAGETLTVTVYAANNQVAQWTASGTGPGPWQNTWARTVSGAAGVVLADSAGNVLARYGQVPGG